MINFNGFPSGTERKKDRAEVRADTIEMQSLGENVKKFYEWLDSPLDTPKGKDGWKGSMAASFEGILPEGEKSLKKYIEDTIKTKKGKAVGIEFGGIGTNIFSEFSHNFFVQSVGVSLVDHRPKKRDTTIDDNCKKINHTILQGDIFEPTTYDELKKILGGAKADLIIERMAKGLGAIPWEPFEAGKILNTWYKLLNEGGIMMVQVPFIFNNLLIKWVKKIRADFPGVIEIKYKKLSHDSGHHGSVFSIRKLQNAPEELPLLTTKEVMHTPARIKISPDGKATIQDLE